MDIKTEKREIIAKSEVGVIIARFQTHKLHQGHKNLIEEVLKNHKKVVIFIGISRVQNTKKNPLDFASREKMLKNEYGNKISVLPITDQRANDTWSQILDGKINEIYPDKKTVLYGSRDSFIGSYTGKYPVVELEASSDFNATNIREEVARETLETEDFRAGVIYATYNQRAVTYPTVDVCAYNEKGEILMAKKPNENLWRFVGGFVDTDDDSYEVAGFREFREETGGNCVIKDLEYICSQRIDDWRYKKEESGIMTTLFLGRYAMGNAIPSDDIAKVQWIPIREFSNFDGIRTKVMPEHRDLMTKLVEKVYSKGLIPNVGERLPEREGNITYTIQ